MDKFKTKSKVIHLKAREKEEVSIYTGALRIAYVRNALGLDHRRIEKLYYSSEAHRRLVNRAFSKLQESDEAEWHIPFKVLLGLRPKDFQKISGLFEEINNIPELIDLLDIEMEIGWIQKIRKMKG